MTAGRAATTAPDSPRRGRRRASHRRVRQPGDEARTPAKRALDHELTPERLHAIREPMEAGAGGRIGAADAVVADRDGEELVLGRYANGRLRRSRVLRDVRERLRAEEVRGC